MAKSSKGAKYERDFCGDLSRWWTNGEMSDVFWRTAGSGAMATTRAKKGEEAYGMHGDVRDTHPWGAILTEQFSIELKRGYSGASFQDVIDSPLKSAPQWFEKVIHQALHDAEKGGVPSWWLVVRRDRRVPLLWLPHAEHIEVLREFRKAGRTWVVSNIRGRKLFPYIKVIGVRLTDFFDLIPPETFGGGEEWKREQAKP